MNATYDSELYHHGIKGQKWGVRRFEDKSGHLTSAGKKRYDKYKQYYKDEGMSDEEAAKKAKRKQNIRRALIAAGAIAGVAIGSKLAYEYVGKEHVDQVIKSGKEFQRIATTDRDDFTRTFYATAKRGDKSKYVGLYGHQLKDAGVKEVFKQTAKVTNDIKIASNKNAKKVFDDLYKSDSEFKQMIDQVNRATMGRGANANQRRALSKGGYNNFNYALTDHSPAMEKAKDKFYSKLKEKGYGAIHDLNDSRWSGYDSKQAVVVFDHAKVGKAAISKVEDKKINNKYNLQIGKMAMKQLAPTFVFYGGMIGAVAASSEKQRHEEAVAKNKSKKRGGEKSK